MPVESAHERSDSGKVILVRFEQYLKADDIICIVVGNMVTDVNPLFANVELPINVTLGGMVIDVKLVQPWNAKA